MPPVGPTTPLILVIHDQDAGVRSLEGILKPRGHVVLKAHSGLQALDLATKVTPDAILVSQGLPDYDTVDLIRELRDSATVQSTTPILIVSDRPMGKAERLEALGAGVWDIVMEPIDANELLLRIDTFVRAKQEADRVRDDGMTDPYTGLYNVRGVLRRAKELHADALRFQRPLTCIAFGAEIPTNEAGDIGTSLSAVLQEVTRDSDAIGRLGEHDFVVVAPGTPDEGAVRLADRVLEALQRQADHGGGPEIGEMATAIRAGFCTVSGPQDASAEDLLLRATMALRRAQQGEGSFRVRAFDA